MIVDVNKQFFSGMKAAVPVCLGIIPVGISVGLLGVQVGLTEFETVLMSVMVMAGSAELMVIGMITQGAALSAMIIGTFFINLRHVVMSSSVMQKIAGSTTITQRFLGAFALCDESFAIYSLSRDTSYSFLMGTNTALYAGFVGSTVLGSVLTSFLPQIVIDSFNIAFYAAFLGLLLPSIQHSLKLSGLVILTALLNCLLQCFLPVSWSIIGAMMLGTFIGVFFIDDKDIIHDEENTK